MDLVIRGSEEFGVLAKRLRETGNKGLRKELMVGLRRAAEPAKDAVPPTLGERMPHRGGLAAEMSGTKMSLRTTSGRSPRVRIVANAPHDIAALNRGRLRHKTFGHGPWVDQAVPTGSFSDPIQKRAPQMRLEMSKVIRDVARQIEKGH